MTLVCCWLNKSNSRSRITAIAEGRTSTRIDTGWMRHGGMLIPSSQWVTNSDTTTKLYSLHVRCYDLSALDGVRGIWSTPYYATEIGIGFSGPCFEAMSIIALYRRCLEQLVFTGESLPRPEPIRLVQILQEITTRWFSTSQMPMGSQVDFLVFGYSSVDGQPWAAKVRCGSDKNAELVEFKNPLESQNLQCVGDVGERLTFRKAIKDIRTRIQRHSKRIRPRKGFDARMDAELEAARHESADKKAIENLVIREIRKASNETVGGVVQKAEAILCDDYRCVVTFSKDDQDYILDGLPPAGDGLSYIPIVEKIGG